MAGFQAQFNSASTSRNKRAINQMSLFANHFVGTTQNNFRHSVGVVFRFGSLLAFFKDHLFTSQRLDDWAIAGAGSSQL